MVPLRFVKVAIQRVAPRAVYRYDLWKIARREPEIRWLRHWCRPDRISIDVGANRGVYSCYMLRHSAAVLAFEPLPLMQAQLTQYFGDRVRVYPIALSDRDGQAELRLPRGLWSCATIDRGNPLELPAPRPVETIAVTTRRLDSYGLTKVGFIKIDVEGHEEFVLRGALETLRANRPMLLIEVEDRHNRGSLARVTALLAGLGYEGSFLDRGTLRPVTDFDPARDQSHAHVGMRGKQGRYINNFVFKPSECPRQDSNLHGVAPKGF
jgi:FkbM family methyltransferase